ncbi:histidine phosphatase family protein [Lichenibacterium dinghuense]|uniref:histidine phosphatase family protein n=1 Tax=Lichenibacterium dinghuense TaxID=2895977 RepID=UPI001F22F8CB|nr:histidine phosphatase family protein [Lichenibacterium sp. 6Y81]
MSLPGPRRFFFVRHGETAWNREGRLQGQHDAMLNPLGRSQAAAAGRILAAVLDGRGLRAADRAYVVSPLSRTRDTMELMRAELGPNLPAVACDDRLKEIGFGAWEGRTWEDLKRRDAAAIAERRRDTWNYVPPGGGESYAMLLDRLAPWLAGLVEDAVVVAHGGVARALLHGIAGLEPERAVREEVHQGRVLLFGDGAACWA